MLRLAAAAALPWLSFAVQTTPANALAAPWVIIFEGAPLTRPVVIDDWHENQAIMLGLEELSPPPSAGRPSLRLEMYWGPEVERLLGEGVRPLELRGRVVPQTGRYYPAVADEPATIEVEGIGNRRLGGMAREVLERHGVPTRLGGRSPESEDTSTDRATAIAGLALLAALIGIGIGYGRRSERPVL